MMEKIKTKIDFLYYNKLLKIKENISVVRDVSPTNYKISRDVLDQYFLPLEIVHFL